MSLDTLQEYYERQLRSLDDDEVPISDEELDRIDRLIDDVDEDEYEEEELE